MSGWINWPRDDQHAAIIGKNGSGKTQGAAFMLARRLHKMPWVVLNWKREELLRSIPGAKHLRLGDKVPERPGVYLAEPIPAQDNEAVTDLLWRVWARENCGVMVDEAYMLPARDAAYQAILTQGRSKRIPTITLTQRPAWVSRFVFSEATIIQLYRLNDERDYKTVSQFMPVEVARQLPGPYYSCWYDANAERSQVVAPVPNRDAILEEFRRKLGGNRKAY